MRERNGLNTQQASPQKNAGAGRLFVLIYCVALAMAVLASAAYAWEETSREHEFAQASDQFGYLEMAQDVRRGSAPHGLPKYTVDSEHVRLTIDFLKARGVEVSNNGTMGPNGYHYFAGSDKVICQYPPGAGFLLSLFPEGHALFAWEVVTIALLCAGAAWGIWRAMALQTAAAAFSAGMACLAVQGGLLILGLAVSYSVDLLCVPMLLALLAVFIAREGENWKWIVGRALVCGAAVGFATLVRLAAVFFLPGFLMLLLGVPGRKKSLPIAAFLLGFLLAGVVPLMVHQHGLTGSFFSPTYTPADASPPSFASIKTNLYYYFLGDGKNMALWLAVGAIGFVLWAVGQRRGGDDAAASDRRERWYAAAAVTFWLVPTVYFLTHTIVTPYYQLPTIFVCLAAMALAVMRGRPMRHAWLAAFGAAVTGGFLLFVAAYLPPLVDESQYLVDTALPVGMDDPHAWIVGDRLLGTLWYYHGIAGQQIDGMDPATRNAFVEFIQERHEPLFVMADNPAMENVVRELQGNGVALRDAGTFAASKMRREKRSENVTVYRVEWPAR